MPQCARLADPLSCDDNIKTASGNVFANGLPVARVTDTTAGHSCFPSTDITTGSSNVFVNFLPCAFVGSLARPHTCVTTHQGRVVNGSPNVFIN